MAVKDKTVMPGVVVRKLASGGRSVRFSCMINGRRFTKTCELPIELLVDSKTGRPTGDLRAEYNIWVEQCSHKVGKVLKAGYRMPTLSELVATYEKIATARSLDPNYRKPSARAIETAVKNFKYCVQESGLDMERPYVDLMDPDMVRRVFDRFSKRMKGISAWSYIMSLRTVTASWTLPKYRDLGYAVEPPTMPDVGNIKRAPEYKMLSPEMKAKIEAWYTGLAKEDDKRLYLAASIVAQLAVRPNDVARLTAENFVKYPEDPHVHLVYRPHKTLESSNRRVDWPISAALWDQVCAVAGDRLREGKTLIEAPRSVFDRLNQSMRKACGMEDWNKAVYELRKLCVDTVRREQGVDAAVALSGDRRETIDRYYSDPYKLTGITPLEIMPMPAIDPTATA